MGHVRHIFIAPAAGAPMVALPEVQALGDCGLAGDRYADPALRQSPDCQLTLIELENIEAFAQASGLALGPADPRRNLVTVGVRLNEFCGRRFRVGEVELEGLDLAEFGRDFYPEFERVPEVILTPDGDELDAADVLLDAYRATNGKPTTRVEA